MLRKPISPRAHGTIGHGFALVQALAPAVFDLKGLARTYCYASAAQTTLHAYRVRWSAAEQDPQYSALEERLLQHPKISIPTIVLHGEEDGASLVQSSEGQESDFTAGYRRQVLAGVGHFVQRESPQAVIDAVLSGT